MTVVPDRVAEVSSVPTAPAVVRAGVLFVVCVALAVAGCAPSRSREAFCGAYRAEKAAYLTKYQRRSTEIDSSNWSDLTKALVSLGSGLEAIGDVEVMFTKLADVAPDEIRADVEAVRDSIKQEVDAAKGGASNPLGALASGLVSALTSMGSWQRVGDYVQANCEGGAT